MPDLSTTYLGLQLRNPLVASAGPLTQSTDGFAALAAGGVGAIVMFSLFEEQLRHEAAHDMLLEDEYAESFAESLSYFPTVPSSDVGLSARYVETLQRGIEAAGDVPVIASLNGTTIGSWVEFAQQLADAGASALELNIYLVPGDTGISGREVEDRHVEILEGVKNAVNVPVAVKLSPYFSSLGEMAHRLVDAGADGLVLFNRFLQPEIDIETLQVEAGVTLSRSVEGRLPRTWIAALRGRVNASLALTSGVETGEDVIRSLLAGADVVMTTSAMLRRGPGYAHELLGQLTDWLGRKEFDSVSAMRGLLAVPAEADHVAYERAGYLAALEKAKETYAPMR
ncbi:dihydroorotate dehydrogenase-like protein [Granulicoccus sp. GXG6511]|uniref:dihydroorotate dehydrogenase-like protein n=1 Tax=Granulicoccus sp. GXG6511 TaxID=3381351 RepID=UPI003D7D963E